MTQQKVFSRTSTEEEIASDYKWGFVTDIEADTAPKGLNEDVVRMISAQEGRAGVDDRVAPEGVPLLDDSEDYKEPRWAKV